MMTIFTGRWLQRVAALLAMVMVLYTVAGSIEGYSWAIWSIIAIALVLEFLAYQTGVAQGIQIYREMNAQQRADIDQIFEKNNNE